MTERPINQNWWAGLYDDLLADVLLVRDDPNELKSTLDFLSEALGIQSGDRVLDQCCGIGSLSIPLAARGFVLIGVDQAAAYTEQAAIIAREQAVNAKFHAADASLWVSPQPCRAAFNWWTSFGYGVDDKSNAQMLARAYDSLAPGGIFALDTLHLPGVLRHFQKDVVLDRHTRFGKVVLWRNSQLDLAQGRLNKSWTYLLDDGRRVEHKSSIRLYMPHSIVDMLQSVGFESIKLYGNINKDPIHLDSPRCICVARRPL